MGKVTQFLGPFEPHENIGVEKSSLRPLVHIHSEKICNKTHNKNRAALFTDICSSKIGSPVKCENSALDLLRVNMHKKAFKNPFLLAAVKS